MNIVAAAIGRPYIPGWTDLGPFVAEGWLIVTVVGLLLAPFFARRRNLACFLVALAGLTAALISLLWVGVPAPGRAPLRGILIADSFALLWKAMLIVFTVGVLFLWRSTTASEMREGDGPEFFTLLIGATLGMSLMASTTNLLMIVMAVELASLPSYVLAGFRKTHRLGAEASLKYVLFGAGCSALMIYALTFLYGMYGTLDLGAIARQVQGGAHAHPALLTIAFFGLIAGVGFKIAAVPFHFWCPDVFEGASVEVTAFLSVASKGAGLVLLLRVLMTFADAMEYRAAQPLVALAYAVGILGAITATVGNTAAFAQNNIKRLLAYSSIAHAGYMMCAVSLLFNLNGHQTDAASGVNAPAQVLLFYLTVYLFMNLGAFAVAALVYRATGSEDISAFNGLVKRNPVLAHAMMACMISLIGLPPFAGFVAKLNLMLVLMNNGGGWWILVAVIAVNSIASAFYYFRVLRAIYLEPAGADQPAFAGHPLGVALAAGSGLALVLMLVLASPVSALTRHYARMQGIGGAAATPATKPVVTVSAAP
ncbi:MAG: NADH-quinone oxidoreductase subunit [Phycisphaerales bacterium]|nr:NADH-quinone oxidoreductase subunit [Phycisphaerales bacterium]